MYLDQLRRGDTTYDDGDTGADILPPDLDMAKFDRGRRFFISNVYQCSVAMLYAFICGLSVTNILDVLVATNKSDTPQKSIRRYLSSASHLLRWHYGNVWDPQTSAGKSIRDVRRIHVTVRKFMMKERERETNNVNESRLSKSNVSQYDMSLVQSGFIGAIITYPREFGIRCSKSNLDDYVYYWRWISYLLGISDANNICCGGFEKAYAICKEIEQDILLPAMKQPPKCFYPMAKAFTDGMSLQFHFQFMTPEYIIARAFDTAGSRQDCPFKIRFSDRLRMLRHRCLSFLCYYVPFISWCLCKIEEHFFQCQRMT